MKPPSQSKQTVNRAIKALGMSLFLMLLFSFINGQYARAVGVHKMIAPLSLERRHPVKQLVRSRFYRGDMINSYQRSQFSVTILCPQELALLLRQVARGIHLCGLISGLYRLISGVAALRVSLRPALASIFSGATIFGCAMGAPDYMRALAIWSLGYAPF